MLAVLRLKKFKWFFPPLYTLGFSTTVRMPTSPKSVIWSNGVRNTLARHQILRTHQSPFPLQSRHWLKDQTIYQISPKGLLKRC